MTKGVVQISHDGFARESLVRDVVPTLLQTCDWCGQNPYGRLFRYGVQPDSISGRINWCKGLFCCIECFRSYQ